MTDKKAISGLAPLFALQYITVDKWQMFLPSFMLYTLVIYIKLTINKAIK